MKLTEHSRQTASPVSPLRLPTLPPGVPYLLSRLSDENLGYRELAGILEGVPTIAARILALANSAWAAPVNPVTALATACGLLGIGVVRSVSVALAVSSPFSSNRCPEFEVVRFWQSALLTADAASLLHTRLPAHLRRTLDVQTVRTAGLLQHLGLVWMADSLAEPTNQALERVSADPGLRLHQALRESVGMGYDEAGTLLANAWNLPVELREAMGRQHPAPGESPLILLVAGAGDLVSSLLSEREPVEACSLMEILGLSPKTRQSLREELRAEAVKVHALASTLFSAAVRV